MGIGGLDDFSHTDADQAVGTTQFGGEERPPGGKQGARGLHRLWQADASGHDPEVGKTEFEHQDPAGDPVAPGLGGQLFAQGP